MSLEAFAGVGYPSLVMDDPNKRNSPDSKFIAMEQEHEVKYWTTALGVSKEALQRAVNSVGNSVEKVREALRRQEAPKKA